MSNDDNKKQKQVIRNPLETLSDTASRVGKGMGEIAKSTTDQMKREATEEFRRSMVEQLFGKKTQRKSGELIPGASIEMNEVLSKNQSQIKESERTTKQARFESWLVKEERAHVERKTNELRMQLDVIQKELIVVAENTQNLAEETKVAAMQAPVDPGIYHIIFFEKLLDFVKSFRKKIEDAAVWLNSLNKRAAKKGGNMWGKNYQKHGAKYLLSGEHYVTRSAG